MKGKLGGAASLVKFTKKEKADAKVRNIARWKAKRAGDKRREQINREALINKSKPGEVKLVKAPKNKKDGETE